jgi:sugar phosphate isomerase/epimerase
VSTQLYHGQRLCRAHLEEIAAQGFDTIEVVATRTHLDYHDGNALDEFARWLGETGLRLHSIHAPVTESVEHGRWGVPFSTASPDPGVRERAVAEAKAALELARRVPVDVLVVHLGLPDSMLQAPNGNSRAAARQSVEEIAAAAGALSVRVALENIPGALSTPESIVALIEDELDLPILGACLDFGHANIMGGVADAIDVMGGVLIATHLHDNGGSRDEHLPPFEGSIDWQEALMGLAKVGYEGVLMIEVAAHSAPAPAILERARMARERFDTERRSWA